MQSSQRFFDNTENIFKASKGTSTGSVSTSNSAKNQKYIYKISNIWITKRLAPMGTASFFGLQKFVLVIKLRSQKRYSGQREAAPNKNIKLTVRRSQ